MKRLLILSVILCLFSNCEIDELPSNEEQQTEKPCSVNSNGDPIPCDPEDDNGEG